MIKMNLKKHVFATLHKWANEICRWISWPGKEIQDDMTLLTKSNNLRKSGKEETIELQKLDETNEFKTKN